MVDFGANDMMSHFIYCDSYGFGFEILKEIILETMRKYGIQSSILTMLHMYRRNLITKEKSKQAAEGKLKNDPDWKKYKGSINDDLDSLVNNLQNSEKTDSEEVLSFFTPKLTKEELELVERDNYEHMKTYIVYRPDVDVEKMRKSDSMDKYVHTRCIRSTKYLSLESARTLSEDISTYDTSENSSDDSFEDLSEDVLSNVSSDVRTTTEWADGWAAGWAAGWEWTQDSSPVEWAMGWAAGLAAGLFAGRMSDRIGDRIGGLIGGQPDGQSESFPLSDDQSSHSKSSTRRRNSL